MKSILITGSGGLVGSEVVSHFAEKGWLVTGVDNNMRADFFGAGGDTSWNVKRLKESVYRVISTLVWISETDNRSFRLLLN